MEHSGHGAPDFVGIHDAPPRQAGFINWSGIGLGFYVFSGSYEKNPVLPVDVPTTGSRSVHGNGTQLTRSGSRTRFASLAGLL
jgi:hypothetical protein